MLIIFRNQDRLPRYLTRAAGQLPNETAFYSLLKKYRLGQTFRMPAPAPELFEIEAASPEFHEPEDETYVIRMCLHGTYEVRWFLNDNGVDEKRIAFAIEELSRSRRVRVRN